VNIRKKIKRTRKKEKVKIEGRSLRKKGTGTNGK
jgi:hypothetical protein